MLPSITQEDTMAARWEWLMERITPKDHRAFIREAYRILARDADAVDVVQEAYLKGCMTCWQLRDDTKVFQWMFSIVRKEALRVRRETARTNPFGSLPATARNLIAPDRPEDIIISMETKDRFLKALEGLDEESREIFIKKRSTDMSLRQIAKERNMKYDTVKSKYRRAQEILRDKLMEESQ